MASKKEKTKKTKSKKTSTKSSKTSKLNKRKGGGGLREIKINLDASRDRAKEVDEASRNRGSGKYFRFPKKFEGKVYFRLLGTGNEDLANEGRLGKPVQKHFLNFKGKFQGSHLCPVDNEDPKYGDWCPICTALERMDDAGSVDDGYIKDKGSRGKSLFNIYTKKLKSNKGEVTEVDKVQIMEAPMGLYDELQNMLMDPDEFGSFYQMHEGNTIVMTRTGSGLDTEYAYNLSTKSGPILPDEDDTSALADEVSDLVKQTHMSEKDMAKAIEEAEKLLADAENRFGGDIDIDIEPVDLGGGDDEDEDEAEDEDDDEDEDEDEKASSRTKRGKKSKKPADDDEDEDEDEDGDQPKCFGDFADRNPKVQMGGKPKDKECKDCPAKIPCQFDAVEAAKA